MEWDALANPTASGSGEEEDALGEGVEMMMDGGREGEGEEKHTGTHQRSECTREGKCRGRAPSAPHPTRRTPAWLASRPGPGGGRAVPPHRALRSLGPSQESKGSVGLAVRHVAGLICDMFNLVASFHLMLEL